MAACLCSFKGIGSMYFRDRSGTNKIFYDFGNATEFQLNAEEETEDLQNFTDSSGGLCASSTRVSNIELVGTFYDFCPRNLEVALRAVTGSTVGGAVTAQAHESYKGLMIKLKPIADPAAALLVKNTGGAVTYVENTDYIRTHSGIWIPETSGIPNATPGTPNIEVTYTGLATERSEALVTDAKEYELVFDGMNVGRSNSPYRLVIHRGKFGLFNGFPASAQQYGSYQMTAKILAAPEIVGAGFSKYFYLDQVKP